MTIAKEILSIFGNWVEKINEAESQATEVDQNWEREETVFTFKDGSGLKFSHPAVEEV